MACWIFYIFIIASIVPAYYSRMLCPLLFVLYMSDVPRVINECVLLRVIYADDTQIYIKVKQCDIQVAKSRSRTA